MSDRYIGVHFYIPLDRRPASDDELFHELGCDASLSFFGTFCIYWRHVELLSDHVCAQLFFSHAEFINRLCSSPEPTPLEQDRVLPLGIAIRDGAVRLGAEAAIFSSHNWVLEKLLDKYWMVLSRDATTLAAEWYGMLYMDDYIVEGWDPPAHLVDRDELPGGPGRTLFGGRGTYRWS